MRSKGTETGDTLEGDPPEDERGVSSSVPSGGVSHWTQPTPAPVPAPRACPSTSDMLYVNLEETYPASPPFLERDPNMSSAARYSPLHHAHPHPPLPPFPPQGHYMQPYTMHQEVMGEEAPPLLPYYPALSTGADAYGVSSSSSSGVPFLPPPRTHHLLDSTTDLQLVLASNGEYHMIDGSGMKAEHVELLITGGQSGISYSLSSENGFIVARPTSLAPCTGSKDRVDVIAESNAMAVDVSLLDSLDEGTQFDGDQSIVMESETLDNTNLHLDISQSDELVLSHDSGGDISPSHLEDVGCEEMVAFEEFAEYLGNAEPTSTGSRNRRKQQSLLSDDNSITCIPDKSVPCRARASLPGAHLSLGRPGGVFARRRIPARARFGPLEGLRHRAPPGPPQGSAPYFLLHTRDGDFAVDVSDEKTSNWMRYVRFEPGPSQNVCLQQSDSELYFISCRPIAPRQELILGYGSSYARHWGLQPPPPHATDSDESSLEWPCYECSMRFASSPELQAHLNMHDEDEKKSATMRKPRKKPTKANSSGIAEHRCATCNRSFPRSFSLKRHMLTHGHLEDTSKINNDGSAECETIDCLQPEVELTLVTFENSNINMEVDTGPNTITNPVDFEPVDLKREAEMKIGKQERLEPDSQIDHDSVDSSCTDHLTSEDSYCSGQKENTPVESNTDIYLCNMCNKMCSTLEEYEQHKNSHREKKGIFPCPSCPPGEGPRGGASDSVPSRGVYCLICPRTFAQSWLLKEHTKTQHRRPDGQYDCPMCDKRLSDYASIKKHIRGFHAVRRFSCQMCATNFSTPDKLRMHMLKHSEHREFLCPDCGKQFKRKDKLKDHIKKIHNSARKDNEVVAKVPRTQAAVPPADPTAYLSFTFKCHPCKLGFKRRGMLVNHLARRHPEVTRSSVPELQLPILRAARDYYCQYCYKVYKSSSKRKAHILKNHPGESVPPSSRGVSLPSGGSWAAGYSACVGAVPSAPHHCPHQPCHKQYASKAKLLQHIRLNHPNVQSDIKENAMEAILPQEIIAPKDNVTSSTNQSILDTKLHAPNLENKISRTVIKSNIVILKSQPPPLAPVSSAAKGDNKILSGLLTTDSSSLMPLSRHTISREFIKKPISMDLDNMKHQLSTSKQYQTKIGWKTTSDSTNMTELLQNSGNGLRLVQLCDGIQVLEGAVLPDSSAEDGDKLSMDGNKLPPMSVLASGAMTRYTDR